MLEGAKIEQSPLKIKRINRPKVHIQVHILPVY